MDDSAVAARARQLEAQILDDSSVTDDLDDTPAKVLLEWGLQAARRIAEATAGQPDVQAGEVMDAAIVSLRRTMRRVGKLVADFDSLAPDELADKLAGVLDAGGATGVLSVPPDVAQALKRVQSVPAPARLTLILSLMQ